MSQQKYKLCLLHEFNNLILFHLHCIKVGSNNKQPNGIKPRGRK